MKKIKNFIAVLLSLTIITGCSVNENVKNNSTERCISFEEESNHDKLVFYSLFQNYRLSDEEVYDDLISFLESSDYKNSRAAKATTYKVKKGNTYKTYAIENKSIISRSAIENI